MSQFAGLEIPLSYQSSQLYVDRTGPIQPDYDKSHIVDSLEAFATGKDFPTSAFADIRLHYQGEQQQIVPVATSATPATPATPVTPATPATPVTPATPATPVTSANLDQGGLGGASPPSVNQGGSAGANPLTNLLNQGKGAFSKLTNALGFTSVPKTLEEKIVSANNLTKNYIDKSNKELKMYKTSLQSKFLDIYNNLNKIKTNFITNQTKYNTLGDISLKLETFNDINKDAIDFFVPLASIQTVLEDDLDPQDFKNRIDEIEKLFNEYLQAAINKTDKKNLELLERSLTELKSLKPEYNAISEQITTSTTDIQTWANDMAKIYTEVQTDLFNQLTQYVGQAKSNVLQTLVKFKNFKQTYDAKLLDASNALDELINSNASTTSANSVITSTLATIRTIINETRTKSSELLNLEEFKQLIPTVNNLNTVVVTFSSIKFPAQAPIDEFKAIQNSIQSDLDLVRGYDKQISAIIVSADTDVKNLQSKLTSAISILASKTNQNISSILVSIESNLKELETSTDVTIKLQEKLEMQEKSLQTLNIDMSKRITTFTDPNKPYVQSIFERELKQLTKDKASVGYYESSISSKMTLINENFKKINTLIGIIDKNFDACRQVNDLDAKNVQKQTELQNSYRRILDKSNQVNTILSRFNKITEFINNSAASAAKMLDDATLFFQTRKNAQAASEEQAAKEAKEKKRIEKEEKKAKELKDLEEKSAKKKKKKTKGKKEKGETKKKKPQKLTDTEAQELKSAQDLLDLEEAKEAKETKTDQTKPRYETRYQEKKASKSVATETRETQKPKEKKETQKAKEKKEKQEKKEKVAEPIVEQFAPLPLLTDSFKLPFITQANKLSELLGLIILDKKDEKKETKETKEKKLKRPKDWGEWSESRYKPIHFDKKQGTNAKPEEFFVSKALTKIIRNQDYFAEFYQQFLTFWLRNPAVFTDALYLDSFDEQNKQLLKIAVAPKQLELSSAQTQNGMIWTELDEVTDKFIQKNITHQGGAVDRTKLTGAEKEKIVTYAEMQQLYLTFALTAKIKYQGMAEWKSSTNMITPLIAAICVHGFPRQGFTKSTAKSSVGLASLESNLKQEQIIYENALFVFLCILSTRKVIQDRDFLPTFLVSSIHHISEKIKKGLGKQNAEKYTDSKVDSTFKEFITRQIQDAKIGGDGGALTNDQYVVARVATNRYIDLAKRVQIIDKNNPIARFNALKTFLSDEANFISDFKLIGAKKSNNLTVEPLYNASGFNGFSLRATRGTVIKAGFHEGIRQDLETRLQNTLEQLEQDVSRKQNALNTDSDVFNKRLRSSLKTYLDSRYSELLNEFGSEAWLPVHNVKLTDEEFSQWLGSLTPGKVVNYLHPRGFSLDSTGLPSSDLGSKTTLSVSNGRIFLYIPYAPFIWLEEGDWSQRPGQRKYSEFLIKVPLENVWISNKTPSSPSSPSSQSEALVENNNFSVLDLITKMRQYIQTDEVYEYAQDFVEKALATVNEAIFNQDLSDLSELSIKENEKEIEESKQGKEKENEKENSQLTIRFGQQLTTTYDKILEYWNTKGKPELRKLLPFMINHQRSNQPDAEWNNLFISDQVAEIITSDLEDAKAIIPTEALYKEKYMAYYNPTLFKYMLSHLSTDSYVTIADRQSNWKPVVAKIINLDLGFDTFATNLSNTNFYTKGREGDSLTSKELHVTAWIYQANNLHTERKISLAFVSQWLNPIYKLNQTQISNLKTDLIRLHEDAVSIEVGQPGASLHHILKNSLFNQNFVEFEALLKQMRGRETITMFKEDIKGNQQTTKMSLGTLVNFAHPTQEKIVQGEVVWGSESSGLAFDAKTLTVKIHLLTESDMNLTDKGFPIQESSIYTVPLVCIVKWIDMDVIAGSEDGSVIGMVGDFVTKSTVTHLY